MPGRGLGLGLKDWIQESSPTETPAYAKQERKASGEVVLAARDKQ